MKVYRIQATQFPILPEKDSTRSPRPICSKGKARQLLLFFFSGMTVCLLSSYVSTFLALSVGADQLKASLTVAPPVEEIMSRTGWETITAVKNGAILNLQNNELSRPAPRLAEGAQMLFDFVVESLAAQELAPAA